MKVILTIRGIFVLFIFVYVGPQYFPTFSTFERIIAVILFFAFVGDYIGMAVKMYHCEETITKHDETMKKLIEKVYYEAKSQEIEELKKEEK